MWYAVASPLPSVALRHRIHAARKRKIEESSVARRHRVHAARKRKKEESSVALRHRIHAVKKRRKIGFVCRTASPPECSNHTLLLALSLARALSLAVAGSRSLPSHRPSSFPDSPRPRTYSVLQEQPKSVLHSNVFYTVTQLSILNATAQDRAMRHVRDTLQYVNTVFVRGSILLYLRYLSNGSDRAMRHAPSRLCLGFRV